MTSKVYQFLTANMENMFKQAMKIPLQEENFKKKKIKDGMIR